MSEDTKKDQYVTKSDLKEDLFGIKEQMLELKALPNSILKTQVTMTIVLGAFLFWLIDRDFDKIQLSLNQYNEHNQARLSRLEEINLTPTNQVLLTRVNDFLDSFDQSKNNKRGATSSNKKKPGIQKIKGR